MPAIIQFYAPVGAPSEANGGRGIGTAEFEALLRQAEATGEKKAQLRISSGGGSWLDAQNIYALCQSSPLNIDTYNDGLAASSASLLLMAGRNRYMAAHARLMIHNCSSPAYGQVADLENAIKQQQHINESLAQVYQARTGLPMEQIQSMMNSGDYWLSAEDALRLGFIDAIVPTPYAAPAPEVTAGCAADQVTATLDSYYDTLILNNSFPMKNLLLPVMAAAGVTTVTASSTDAEVTAGVQALVTERDTLKVQKEEADKKLADATAALEATTAAKKEADEKLEKFQKQQADDAAAAQEQKATAVVDAAVASGRIVAAARPHYLTMAKSNLEATTAALDALPGKGTLTEAITAAATGKAVTTTGQPALAAASVMAEINARTNPAALKPA